MLHDANLIAFVGTTKPADARSFYEAVLGLPLLADEPSALVFDANGTMLRISKVESFTSPLFTVLGWEVDDIAASIDELVGRGVTFEQFDVLEQDDRGIATFPDGTRVTWFKDPDGNMLSLTQFP